MYSLIPKVELLLLSWQVLEVAALEIALWLHNAHVGSQQLPLSFSLFPNCYLGFILIAPLLGEPKEQAEIVHKAGQYFSFFRV
jgi:hypothetical protein